MQWHISTSGKVEQCTATQRACPLGTSHAPIPGLLYAELRERAVDEVEVERYKAAGMLSPSQLRAEVQAQVPGYTGAPLADLLEDPDALYFLTDSYEPDPLEVYDLAVAKGRTKQQQAAREHQAEYRRKQAQKGRDSL